MPATPTRLLNSLRAYGLWLFVRPRLFWMGASAVVAAVALCWAYKTESVVRTAGLVLELLGLGTTGWGLNKARQDFNQPSLMALAGGWWAARPKWH